MNFSKYAKYLGAATLVIGFATGCQSTGTSSNMDTSSAMTANEKAVQVIITDAKSALEVAVKDGYAWRDTGKFIKKAEKALAAGDTAEATTLATKALQQTELAKKQSIEQDKAVKELFNQS